MRGIVRVAVFPYWQTAPADERSQTPAHAKDDRLHMVRRTGVGFVGVRPLWALTLVPHYNPRINAAAGMCPETEDLTPTE